MNSFKMIKMLKNTEEFEIKKVFGYQRVIHKSGIWWYRSVGCGVIHYDNSENISLNYHQWLGFLGFVFTLSTVRLFERRLYKKLEIKAI